MTEVYLWVALLEDGTGHPHLSVGLTASTDEATARAYVSARLADGHWETPDLTVTAVPRAALEALLAETAEGAR